MRLWCLAAKGYTDIEIDNRAEKQDWLEAQQIAKSLGDDQWAPRATGELGVIAFLEGNSGRAAKLLGGALVSTMANGDKGGQIRFLEILGIGMVEVNRPTEALMFFERANKIGESERDSGLPFMGYEGKAQALVALGRPDEAKAVLQDALAKARAQQKRGHEAQLLLILGKLAEQPDGSYVPFHWKSSLSILDIELSDETYIIQKETAEAYVAAKTSSVTTPAVQLPVTETPESPTATTTPPFTLQPRMTQPTATAFTRVLWQGDVPPQKWMNFYTKVLSKFATQPGLRIGLSVEIAPEGGVSPQKVDEIRVALRELACRITRELNRPEYRTRAESGSRPPWPSSRRLKMSELTTIASPREQGQYRGLCFAFRSPIIDAGPMLLSKAGPHQKKQCGPVVLIAMCYRP